MKISRSVKLGFFAITCTLVFVGQSMAVDLAAAAGVMAEVESMSVHAKANLAEAALAGDTDAIMEAKKRSDAIDGAVASARAAFAKMETDIKGGEMDAAEAAEDDLAATLVQVKDALIGAIPEALAEEVEQTENAEMAGGAPGNPDDPPNIYEVPWKSEGIKAYYQGLFGEFWNASAFGHGNGLGDRDATPE